MPFSILAAKKGWHPNIPLSIPVHAAAAADDGVAADDKIPDEAADPPGQVLQTRWYAYYLFECVLSAMPAVPALAAANGIPAAPAQAALPQRQEPTTILHAGRLFQQCLVDAWASCKHSLLSWICQNQNTL